MNQFNAQVRLRPVEEADLPLLYQNQLDPESTQLAFVHPRSAADFDAHWAKILADASVNARSIVFEDLLAGCISCFGADGKHYVGYWIGREYWGNGIATQALRLLLDEVSIRPLYAHVAVSNVASIRVLENGGFQEIRREWSPETDRLMACDEVVMRLSN